MHFFIISGPLAGSTQNRMWVRFFSDESQNGRGFVLNITLQGKLTKTNQIRISSGAAWFGG
jgi:hypothetical protein